MYHKVFVYGTLKRRNKKPHGAMEGQKYLGVASIKGSWGFVSFNAFPAIVLPRPGTTVPLRQIKGEVYRVDDACLANLDRIEGFPSFYTRVKVQIKHHGEVFVYMLPHDKAAFGTPISGDSWPNDLNPRPTIQQHPTVPVVNRPANLPDMQWTCHVPLTDGTVAEMEVAAVSVWDAIGIAKNRAIRAGMDPTGTGVTAKPTNGVNRALSQYTPKPYVPPKVFENKFFSDPDVCSPPKQWTGSMNGGW